MNIYTERHNKLIIGNIFLNKWCTLKYGLTKFYYQTKTMIWLIDVLLDSRHCIILSISPFVYVDVPLPNVKDQS